MRNRQHEAGFTLLELLIVIAILAVLAAILVPNFIRARASSQLASCELNLRNIAAALELYYGENQLYPPVASWTSSLTLGGYIRAVPTSPVDQASFVYATNGGQNSFVLSDGPNKYTQAGISGYVVYTAAGGLQIGVSSVPTP